MGFRRTSVWHNVDWITIVLYLTIVIVGWGCVYSAGYNFDNASIFDLDQRFGKQLIWIGICIITAMALLLIDSDFYQYFSYFIYATIILILITTIFLAEDVKGSRSWLTLGPLTVQPAEFAKFATALALATFMNSYNFKLFSLKNSLTTGAIILLPMTLILLQKETGSALVFAAFLLVLYREGMSGMILYSGLLAITIFILSIKFGGIMISDETSFGEVSIVVLTLLSGIVMLWMYQPTKGKIRILLLKIIAFFAVVTFLLILTPLKISYALPGYICIVTCAIILLYYALLDKIHDFALIGLLMTGSIAFMFSVNYLFYNVLQPHQRIRIEVLLGLKEDLNGAGYNVNQSKIAIGSGGITGKGFLNGTQTKLKYVPEQDTDFIFCTIGEEKGFIGVSIVLGLYLALLLRLVALAERQRYSFGRIYGYSVVSILFFHITVNVGMVIGLLPVIGIPLPLLSYGGSSLWAFTILLFIFLSIDAQTKPSY